MLLLLLPLLLLLLLSLHSVMLLLKVLLLGPSSVLPPIAGPGLGWGCRGWGLSCAALHPALVTSST